MNKDLYRGLRYGMRLMRAAEWWDKLLHLSGSAFLILYHSGQTEAGARGLALYTASVLCLLSGGYAINDIADHNPDRIVGRAVVRRDHSIATAAAMLAMGMIFLCASTNRVLPNAIALVTVLIGAGYSLPPLRIKERGVWGLIAGAVAQRPALFLIFAAMHGTWDWLGAILTAWLLFGGLLGMLGHQILDYPRDLAAGVRTFVTAHGQRLAMSLCMTCAAAIGIAVIAPLFLAPPPEALPVAGMLAALSSVFAVKGARALRKMRSDPSHCAAESNKNEDEEEISIHGHRNTGIEDRCRTGQQQSLSPENNPEDGGKH